MARRRCCGSVRSGNWCRLACSCLDENDADTRGGSTMRDSVYVTASASCSKTAVFSSCCAKGARAGTYSGGVTMRSDTKTRSVPKVPWGMTSTCNADGFMASISVRPPNERPTVSTSMCIPSPLILVAACHPRVYGNERVSVQQR